MQGDIYGTYGRLAMYDRGIDDLARHCVVGYKVHQIQTPPKYQNGMC